MHGNGLYLFDQKDFYANATEPTATKQLWEGVAAGRAASSRLDSDSSVVLEPEVAIFTDDASALHWTVSSGAHHGTEDQRPDPNVAWPAAGKTPPQALRFWRSQTILNTELLHHRSAVLEPAARDRPVSRFGHARRASQALHAQRPARSAAVHQTRGYPCRLHSAAVNPHGRLVR